MSFLIQIQRWKKELDGGQAKPDFQCGHHPKGLFGSGQSLSSRAMDHE